MTEDPAAQEKLAALDMSCQPTPRRQPPTAREPIKDSENIETVKGLRKADLLIKGRHFADAVPVCSK